jgi:hypothetical protein
MFEVGQKVVCVDASRMGSPFDWSANGDVPKEGAVYTVVRVGPSPVPQNDGVIVVWLAEIKHFCRRSGVDYWDCGYSAKRFRPVKTTSIDVFQKILIDASNKQTVSV